MLRTSISLLITFCFTSGVFAFSGEADSIEISRLFNKAKELSKTDLQGAFRQIAEAKHIASKNHSDKLYAAALYEESQYLYQEGKYAEMVDSCVLAAKLFKKANLASDEAKCYSKIGVGYANMNRYKDALQAFFTALSVNEAIDDDKAVAAVNQNIGIVYTNLKDWDNALKFSLKSLEYKKSVNDSVGMASTYSNIGNIYYGKKEYSESVQFFRMAINADNKGPNKSTAMPIRYSNMANSFMEMGKYDSAIFYNEAALKLLGNKKEIWQRLWCQVLTNLGASWFRKGDINKTAFYLKECAPCESTVRDITYLTDLYRLKANYYKQTGDYKEAVKYSELASNIKDSMLANAQNLEYQKMGIQYEFDQKAHEDSLRYQLALSEQRSQAATYKSRMYLILAIGLAVLFLSVIAISWLRISQRIRRRKELERVRLDIAGDLHDEIGSTISSIQIISSMMGSASKADQKVKEAAENINRLSNKVAGGIREVVWSLNPENDNLEAIVSQLYKITADVLNTANIPFTFVKELRDPKKKLSPQVRKDFMLIFKEAVNNARKYSRATQVDIRIEQVDEKVVLKIKDYGCGFDPETIERGNGLYNMERRAKNLDALLRVESVKEKGTTVHLEVPIA